MVRNKTLDKIIKVALPLIFWIGIWEAASLVVRDELKLFLPGPAAVFLKWLKVGFTAEYLSAAGATLVRVFAGFLLGVAVGLVLGTVTANVKITDILFSPAMKIVRAVPVVSFIILAFLFIDVDRLPVFISFLMVVPMVWQNVHDGLKNTSTELDEVCRVFSVGRLKSLFEVKLPQILPGFFTVSVSALGFAWKSGVAAEVLCTPGTSLGHIIYSAKANLDFDEVYAATLTVVLLSIIIEMILKTVCRRIVAQRGEKNAEA